MSGIADKGITGAHDCALIRPSPQSLEFDRESGHRPLTALAYRSVRLAGRLVGERRTLSGLLDIARLSDRLAYESTARVFGEEEYHCCARP